MTTAFHSWILRVFTNAALLLCQCKEKPLLCSKMLSILLTLFLSVLSLFFFFFFLVEYTTRLAKAGLCSLLVTRSMFWNYLLNNTRLLWTKKFNTILPYCLSQEFKSKEQSTSKRFLNSLECVARFNLQACVTNHFLIFFFLSLRYVFAAIYTVEMFLKIIGRGFALHKYAYLRNAWNWLDFLVVVLG